MQHANAVIMPVDWYFYSIFNKISTCLSNLRLCTIAIIFANAPCPISYSDNPEKFLARNGSPSAINVVLVLVVIRFSKIP